MQSQSVYSQTEAPGTADARLNTEINMADLDFVAEVGSEDCQNTFSHFKGTQKGGKNVKSEF